MGAMPIAVDEALARQRGNAGGAVGDVELAPPAGQGLGVGAPVTGGAAVVGHEDGPPPVEEVGVAGLNLTSHWSVGPPWIQHSSGGRSAPGSEQAAHHLDTVVALPPDHVGLGQVQRLPAGDRPPATIVVLSRPPAAQIDVGTTCSRGGRGRGLGDARPASQGPCPATRARRARAWRPPVHGAAPHVRAGAPMPSTPLRSRLKPSA